MDFSLRLFPRIGFFAIGLFVIGSFLMRWLSGDKFLIVRLFNYLMPWFGFAILPMLVMTILSKRAHLAAILLLALVLIGHAYFPLFYNCQRTADGNGQSIKILSYNVWRDNDNMLAVAEVIGRERPDIVLLQELQPYNIASLTRKLKNAYDGDELQVAAAPVILQAIISRYPIQDSEVFLQKGRAQKALVKTLYGPITIINIHAHKWGWRNRQRQLESLLREDILSAKHPVILGGDFNTNDQSQTYRLVNQYLHNSHWEVGCGFGFTYPTPVSLFKKDIPLPALIRIDHIFYSDDFIAIRSRTLSDAGGSDHYPVMAELVQNLK